MSNARVTARVTFIYQKYKENYVLQDPPKGGAGLRGNFQPRWCFPCYDFGDSRAKLNIAPY